MLENFFSLLPFAFATRSLNPLREQKPSEIFSRLQQLKQGVEILYFFREINFWINKNNTENTRHEATHLEKTQGVN